MSAPPYMPLYVADYLGDTRHLTTEQHGAYVLLLMALWRGGGRLPAEPARLARLAGLSTARWARTAGEVTAFFTVEDGELTHPRLVAELARIERASEQRRAAGARGGAAKARRARSETVAPATPPPQPGRSPALASQTSESEPEKITYSAGGARAWAKPELDALEAALRQAAGPALNAAAPGLMNLAPILALLRPGQGPPAELEADVLPAVRARAARQRPGTVNGWAYFEPAVVQFRDRRLAGAPAPRSTEASHEPSRPAGSGRAAKRAVWAQILADEAAHGAGEADAPAGPPGP
ncbi:DUF1376 domain-containing protein [Caulobacter sp. 17J80-11]|uniref:YdaU family protein n=1 Tax=Caulobacter sp. 17J80-11 TaxID=2763502 RepID=UPI001653C554|nr:DUF1376 domain-containing protein [Caulobacter sp. 17J80-11]MBC6981411.1 DUF1376 domain-containing protein [Caulobacter sp. 17J80-11]